MNRFKKIIRLTFVFSFIVILFSIISIPQTSAIGEIYNCTSQIEIEYDQEKANQGLLPINNTLEIPVTVNYYVEGRMEDYVPPVYGNMGLDVIIYIDVVETSEWCEAAVIPSVILLPATAEGVQEDINLSIQINREAHAFSQGEVVIRFEATKMGAIQGNTSLQTVSFKNGYFPMLDLDTPKGTSKYVNPNEIARFDLDIENLGNSLTNVSIDVLDIPEGWAVGVPNYLLIDASTFSNESKESIQVSIEPPHNTGYHNDKETITLSLTPSYYKNGSLKGDQYYVTFIVKSKGYATPGFEFVFVLIALSIIVVFARKKQKNDFDGGNKF